MNEHEISPVVAAIIPAAGAGTRLTGEIPKQFLELDGIPILVRTLWAFLAHPDIDIVMLVLPPEQIESGKELIAPFLTREDAEKMLYTEGGETRQHSVHNGAKALPDSIERIMHLTLGSKVRNQDSQDLKERKERS